MFWLNNPQKDKHYKGLPTSPSTLLNMFPGRMAMPMALNVFTMLGIGDPLTSELMNLADTAWLMNEK